MNSRNSCSGSYPQRVCRPALMMTGKKGQCTMLNNLNLMGRLVADPELRYTQSDIPVCNFAVACERRRKKDEESKTDFFRCVSWGKTAEFISKWFHKGEMILLNGTLRQNDFLTEEGEKRYVTEILVLEVFFSGGGKKSTNATPAGLEGMANFDLDEFEEVLGDAPF